MRTHLGCPGGDPEDLADLLKTHAEKVVQHQNQTDPDSFTARYRTDRLVHAEPFGDVRDALRRERQLKGWSRAKKRALVGASNPSWRELGSDATPTPSD